MLVIRGIYTKINRYRNASYIIEKNGQCNRIIQFCLLFGSLCFASAMFRFSAFNVVWWCSANARQARAHLYVCVCVQCICIRSIWPIYISYTRIIFCIIACNIVIWFWFYGKFLVWDAQKKLWNIFLFFGKCTGGLADFLSTCMHKTAQHIHIQTGKSAQTKIIA